MKKYDIIIVGAGTAGMTAAIYALRAGKSVCIFENEAFGGQISSSPRVENYPGIPSVSGAEFSDALVTQITALGATIELENVISVTVNGDGTKKVVTDWNEYECRAVILATGSKHRKLGVEREDELVGKGVSYCAVCDGAFYKGKPVAVVGGGSTALQDAIFLSAYCSSVTLIHRRDEFRGEERLVKTLQTKGNVSFILNSTVKSLDGASRIEGVTVTDKITGAETKIPVDGVFVAVGQMPRNEKFANIVTLDDSGYIASGEDCRTSTDGVFAAGDCRTKTLRQLTTAAADGAVAGTAAAEYCD